MALPSAKRLGKRIIDYPEETVPVISTTEWLGRFYNDPKQDVSKKYNHVFHILIRPFQVKDYLLSLFPILTWITRYSQLIYKSSSLNCIDIRYRCWVAEWRCYRWFNRRSGPRTSGTFLCTGELFVIPFVLLTLINLQSLLPYLPSTDFTHLSLVCSSIV